MDFFIALSFLVYATVVTQCLAPKLLVRLGYFKSTREIWQKKESATDSFLGVAASGIRGEQADKISYDFVVYGLGWPFVMIGIAMIPPLLLISTLFLLTHQGP